MDLTTYAILSKKIKNNKPSPEVVKNAVQDYLTQNPIQELDPTVANKIAEHNNDATAHGNIKSEVTQLKENLKEYVKSDNGVINADKVLKTDGTGKVVFGDMPQTTVDSVALNQMLGEVLV